VSSLLAGASALLAAIAPAVANLDVTSTAGLFGGAVVIAGILSQFLKGQRAHEARVGSFAAPKSPMAAMTSSGSGVTITGGWVPGSDVPGVGASAQPTLDDPALDDPDHVSNEPEITAEALMGRAASSTPSAEHVGLGDDA
jgi:hypothetical protein